MLYRFVGTIYRTLLRRNSVFLTGVFTTAFVTEIVFDTAADKAWDTINRGKQWKDIENKYVQN
ncbi:putative ubiquinol-cytochrome C reductase complex, subunit X [Gigaspora rosea]|uniref:Complex III subunit 9 n=1 Tax=Gigaspora rosea TaxID=44941 RepID=A0A397WAE4_9GLOM|nr:putative ubiquinol-cytochrome C reductase complex, subunit X [Gigaspora rosea]